MRFNSYINVHAEPNGVRIDAEADAIVEYDPPLTEPQYSRKLEVTAVYEESRPKLDILHELGDGDRERLEGEAYEDWEWYKPGGGRDQAEAEWERESRMDARIIR